MAKDALKQRLYLTVANQILELIDSGHFPVGSRLPGERDLAERFNVSRVAIREAGIALQAQGRLEIKTGSGAYVCDGRDASIYGFPKVGPFELTEARALFEAEAAALAASLISDEEIEELQQLIAIMAGQEESSMTANEADCAFHQVIARATNNHAIIFTIEKMWHMRNEAFRVQNIYRNVCERDVGSRVHEHQAILDALKDRDPQAARVAMRAHFLRLIEALLEDAENAAYEEVKRKTSESRARFLLAKEAG